MLRLPPGLTLLIFQTTSMKAAMSLSSDEVLNQPFFVIRSDVQLGHRCALSGISVQQ